MGYLIKSKRILFSILSLLCIFCDHAFSYPADFCLSQAEIYLPDIQIYASLLDENGLPIQNYLKEEFTINIDGQKVATLDVKLFKEADEGVAYTFLLDVSKTMSGEPFNNAINSIKGLINKIGERDKISIITFGDNVNIISDFSGEKEILNKKLDEIQPNHNNTHFFAALEKAFEINNRRDPTMPIRRAIFVITDGKDEGSGITLDDLIRRNEKIFIPVYSIGFTKIGEQYLESLKRISKLTGGKFLKSQDATQISEIYNKTFGEIQSQVIIKTQFESGNADGLIHQIHVIYTKDNYSVSAEKKASFLYEKSENSSENEIISKNKNLIVILAGTAILTIIILFLFIRKKRKLSPQSTDQNIEAFDNEISDRTQSSQAMPSSSVAKEDASDTNDNAIITLIVIKGKEKGKKINASITTKEKSIGRTGADVIVADRGISDLHCSISYDEKRFMVRDLGSVSGTLLNGIPLKTKTIIEDGDTIEIGQCTLRMKVDYMPS